jgi:16S rRNA (guanine(966)-N(2))-methyltransferase RsmD
MNITSGSAKGTKLKVPKGDSLRPSQNQVRLAIFSILESNYLSGFYYDELTALDLFAGTGALGIEALSRGVARVDFVEKDKGHARILKENLELTHTQSRSKIHISPTEKFLQWAQPAIYDLIFVDPPYALTNRTPLKEILPLLKPHGVLILLHDHHAITPELIKRPESPDTNWYRSDLRQYGITAISFYTLQINSN